ncbi:MAG: DUF433 domain-containing protein [Chloroflexota bacterium]
MGDEGSGPGFYSPRMAARVARVRYQSFQAWAKANLLHAKKIVIGDRSENIYTFRDLLLIRLIVRLRAAGARPKAIKVALETIALMSDGDRDAWMRATMVVNAGVVVAFLPDKPEWNPIAASRGPQKLAAVFFPELIQQLRDELVPPDRFPYVEINPNILGGAPVIRGTRISTQAIISVRESGVDPREAYPDLTEEQIENAEAYEEFLGAA